MLNGAELILGAQRLPDGDQPPCAVAGARLREHDRDRDLQLSGFRAGIAMATPPCSDGVAYLPDGPARTGPGICACCRQTAPKACSSPSSIWISCGITGNTRCRATPIGIRNSMGCYAAGRSTRRSSGRTDVSSPCRNAVRRLAGASPVRRFVPGSARRRQAPPAGTRLRVGCRTRRRSPRRSVGSTSSPMLPASAMTRA